MPKYLHIKNFTQFNGLDLRSSEVTRQRGYAREFLNVMRTAQGGLMTRWGHKLRGFGVGSFGIWPYEATDMLSAAKSEILAAGSQILANNHELYRQTGGTFTVANTGAAVTVALYYDTATSQFRCSIVRSGSTLLNQALGTGLESAPYTIASLASAINGLSGLTATATGLTSQAAAFIDVIGDQAIANGASYVATYGTWTAVNRPRWQWKVETADVSVANDTIDLQSALSGAGNVFNPLKDGDAVFWAERTGGAGVCPSPFVAGTTYYVVQSTKTTIKLATSPGAVASNITTIGSGAFYLCSTVVNPGATFWNYAVEMGQPGMRPVSSVQARGVRYFTPGRTTTGTGGASLPYRETAGLSKYDGQIFCRAGLPQLTYGLQVTGSPDVAGTYTDAKGTLARSSVTGWASPRYDLGYRYIDKVGNIIDGQLSGEFNSDATGNGVIEVDLGEDQAQLLLASAGFNSNYGIVSSTATTLSPSVTDGCGNQATLNVGDICYFWDRRQSRFIQRELLTKVSAVLTFSSTSLDLDRLSPNYDDGGTPTFLVNAAISANMRIVIWRSQGTGIDNATKYLVNEIPWSPLHSVYYDDTADESLGATLIETPYVPSLPPASRYLTVFNTQLISAGDDANPNTVSFEDIETPEGMPAGTHSFDLLFPVTGIAPSGEVLVAGSKRQISVVSGDLSEFKFRVESISDNIGITSHESMRQVEEGVLFFQTGLGPYSIVNGRNLQPLAPIKMADGKVAGRVEPYFTCDYSAATMVPKFERAIGVALPNDRLYVLFVPLELPSKLGFPVQGATAATGSIAFVFDYGRNSFQRWAQIDYSAVCEKAGTLYFVGRRYTGFGSGVDYTNMGPYFGTMVRDKGKFSFSDHENPVAWVYQTHWESLGQPGIMKKALRCRISAHEALLAASTPLTLKSYIDYDATALSNSDLLTFTTQKDLDPKLVSENIRAIMMEFSSSEYYKPFIMTGYEMEMVAPFREVFKE